jgi:hypothetical protein
MADNIKDVSTKLQLSHGTNGSFDKGSYSVWLEELESKIRSIHGKVANFFTTGTKWSPKKPVKADYELENVEGEPEFTPEEQAKARHKALTDWQAKCKTTLEKGDMLYEYIMRQISAPSLEVVKNDRDFEEAKLNHCWTELIIICKETHLTMVDKANPDRALERRIALTNERNELRMRESQSLIEYKERFDGLAKTAKSAGCAVQTKPEMGMQFIKGLDERYIDC